MSQSYDPYDPSPQSSRTLSPDPAAGQPGGDGHSAATPDTAKQEARHLKDSATGATQQVAGTVKDEAARVTSEVRQQATQLADETRSQLTEQARTQRDRAVGGLRSLCDELETMRQQSQQKGLGSQLAGEGAALSRQVADFLEQRDPSQLLDEVRGFARRRPGTFLLGAALAGVVAGRLTRGAVSAQSGDAQAARPSTVPPQAPAGPGEIPAARPATSYPQPHGDPLAPHTSGVGAYPPGPATGGEAATAPILDEPYGEQPPPAGYSDGSGYRP